MGKEIDLRELLEGSQPIPDEVAQRLTQELEEGYEDIKAGRTISAEECFKKFNL